jgi:putative transcriptional regulator
MTVVNRIRVLRAEHNWTQADVATKLGVSRQAIHAIENGKYDPGISIALGLAKAFGVRVEDVFQLEESRANTS